MPWFGSAAALEHQWLEALSEHPDSAHLVLDLGGLGRIDYSGAEVLAGLVTEVRVPVWGALRTFRDPSSARPGPVLVLGRGISVCLPQRTAVCMRAPPGPSWVGGRGL